LVTAFWLALFFIRNSHPLLNPLAHQWHVEASHLNSARYAKS